MLEARRPTAARASTSPGTRWPSPATAAQLDQHGGSEGWLARSRCGTGSAAAPRELSAVGLLPAALQGVRHRRPPRRRARPWTRPPAARRPARNPAALLALMWHHAGEGKGRRTWWSSPTRTACSSSPATSSSSSWSRWARRRTSTASVVHQGIAVYGNKGSTDQHAYVQQLRDGRQQLLRHLHRGAARTARPRPPVEVEPGVTSGDYLHGFLLGTREALYEKRPRVDDHHARRARRPHASARSSRSSSGPSASTPRWWTSTPTTSRASRRARRRRRRCWRSRGRRSPSCGRSRGPCARPRRWPGRSASPTGRRWSSTSSTGSRRTPRRG